MTVTLSCLLPGGLLIQVSQCNDVVSIERTVYTVRNTRQHPAVGISAGGSARDVDGAYAGSTFVAAGTAAVGTVEVVGMSEADSVADFMGNNGSQIVLVWIAAQGIGIRVQQDWAGRVAGRAVGEAGRLSQDTGAQAGIPDLDLTTAGYAGKLQPQVQCVVTGDRNICCAGIAGWQATHRNGDGPWQAGDQAAGAILLVIGNT